MNYNFRMKHAEWPVKTYTIVECGVGDQLHMRFDPTLKKFILRGVGAAYPCNYGYVPNSNEVNKHTAVDAIIYEHNKLPTGTVVECNVIGLLPVKISEEIDYKILTAPTYSDIKSLDQVDVTFLNRCSEFFQTYKNTQTEIHEWGSTTKAIEYLFRCSTED